MKTGFLRAMIACYYDILGVSKTASQEEIKGAFRRLALRWHPDRNPGGAEAAETFRRIRRAYEVLSDPEKRRRYDLRRGIAGLDHGNGGSTFQWTHEMCGAVSEALHDILGIHPQGAYPERKVDLRFDLEVTLETLLVGAKEEIRFERVRYCPECRGNGHSRRNGSSTCGRCQGSGEILEEQTLTVTIPPGCTHQSRLRIPGAGDHLHPQAPPGDLVIVCHLLELRDA
ncbi:DnaJ C terminal domain-containing protein [Desulfacinum hydrothermale DSM 13146]|uniref:DnaJ C terminal domain-containing protein n=1 Tax=Desulfacinum hydrothermale DSM 13146 TaxID=1121390 RepID=A0A1W1XI71_9BACT|nr:DnaJ domain-containing protein [Desulfacinum hydrothermale]SMC23693.1 DnaJ C terminal domain-containing protein [Desulfacinum hydrothermale DSM 13146]